MNGNAQLKQMNYTPPIAAAMQQDQQQCIPSTAIKVQIHDGLARIILIGHFDSQMRRHFRDCYTPLIDNAAVQEIRVDMSKVDYLDSSAMGMLLLLKERAEAVGKPVTLLIASGLVSHVLEIANFSKIFNIRHIGPGSRSLS